MFFIDKIIETSYFIYSCYANIKEISSMPSVSSEQREYIYLWRRQEKYTNVYINDALYVYLSIVVFLL